MTDYELDTEKYGWTAVPRDLEALIKTSQTTTPAPFIPTSSIILPDTPIVSSVLAFAKKELPIETFHHSMRVYYYAQSILQHSFPDWKVSPQFNETLLLSSLLHDLGTTPTSLPSTHLSFEFHGALLSHNLLSSLSSPIPQTDLVFETIIRHQDLGTTGFQTRISGLIQLSTIFDNMGLNPELVDKKTVEAVTELWPRRGWSGCFSKTIREECGKKPWAHTTHLGEDEFATGVEGNELMRPYDDKF